MPWTLNDALQECARNTYNSKTMIRTTSGYSGTGLLYANRFLSGINYAIGKIAREKLGQMHTQDVTLDSHAGFQIDSLSKTCLKVIGVKLNSYQLPYETQSDETILVPWHAGAVVSVTYEYKPDELALATDLDTVLPIDQRYVDPKVVCQYANYQFLSEEGTEYDSARADVWLGLFNDGFTNISSRNRKPRKVRYNG